MRDHLIRLDSELGKRIGLTSANFENAILWDCRPAFIEFTQIFPRKPHEQTLHALFKALDKIQTPVRFLAPTTLVRQIASQYGYEEKKDPAGSVYITNLQTKQLFKQ